MSDRLVTHLDKIAGEFNYYGIQFLIAGLDESGGHIAAVGNPGISMDCDNAGFWSIGSGHDAAQQAMMELGHKDNAGLGETLLRVFVAKKRAESAQGVGASTQLAILRANGLEPVISETMTQLGSLYEAHRKEVASNLKTASDKLELGTKSQSQSH